MSAQLRDSIGWDVANWSQAFALFERHLGVSLAGMRALELGCGRNGGLSLWLATRGAEVICSGYPVITEQAKAAHQRHGVTERITYERIDARAIPFRGSLDIVCFKSMLGGIVRDGLPQIAHGVVDEVHAALKPGGWLVLAENLRATRLHAAFRRRFGSGRDRWFYYSLTEMRELLSRFVIVEERTFGLLGSIGRREWQRTVLAKIDRALRPILPCNMHYAVAMAARKKP